MGVPSEWIVEFVRRSWADRFMRWGSSILRTMKRER
jgi:hypothetical protein